MKKSSCWFKTNLLSNQIKFLLSLSNLQEIHKSPHGLGTYRYFTCDAGQIRIKLSHPDSNYLLGFRIRPLVCAKNFGRIRDPTISLPQNSGRMSDPTNGLCNKLHRYCRGSRLWKALCKTWSIAWTLEQDVMHFLWHFSGCTEQCSRTQKIYSLK